ncbi:hypothetical protein TNCV_3909801 [Trichonephila clavipes]|nr:hypothetical protein TNCV_3909801 [Trichonephila clavipes]
MRRRIVRMCEGSICGMSECFHGQLLERLPYADSITSFVSTRTPVKYYGIFSSDTIQATDGHEKPNGWIPPLRAGNPECNSRCKKRQPHP